MSTYAIGDIQGCYETLLELVELCEVDPSRDEVWLVGDLVERGPASLEVLRWAREREDHVRVVLGNNDLYLLARSRGVGKAKRRDTLRDVLEAPDRDEILDWLISRPLLYGDESLLMVHAGLLPKWSVKEALKLAEAASKALQGPKGTRLLERLSVRNQVAWDDDLSGLKRHEAVLRCLCNLRICDAKGQPYLKFSKPPGEVPESMWPWHEFPKRKSRGTVIVCGHWAAQGLSVRDNLVALDTGCVWGNDLTAVRLEDRKVFQVPLRDRLSDAQWARRIGPKTRSRGSRSVDA